MGQFDLLPNGEFDLDSVVGLQRRSVWSRVGLMAITAGLVGYLTAWRVAAIWFALYLVIQIWSLASSDLLPRGGRAARISLYLSAFTSCTVLSAPASALWHHGEVGAAAATLLVCGLLVRLVVTSMGLPVLFWLCAAPMFVQLVAAPILFFGRHHFADGLCGALCGLLVASYFTTLWRVWRQGLTRIEDERQAVLAKSIEAERANAAKGEFLATMSHELRTPLNGMLGMVQALSRTPLTDDQREMAATLDEAGLCLLTVLNNLLDGARLDAQRLTLDPAPFRPDLLLRRAAALFSGAALEKGLDFRVALEPGCDTVLVGDAARIRQIVVNLLSNAVKFTAAGEVSVSAALAVSEGRARLQMVVADTGEGIAPQAQERVFHRFEQADSSATRQFGGTGLGLAIARDLAELMGGRLEVQSALGEGAQFRLSLDLPVGVEAAAELDLPAALTLALDSPSESVIELTPEVLAAPRVRALVAEDNPTNQLVLRTLLTPLGVELVMVDDGAKAVELWTQQGFDLVLMDLHMPVMDGLAATIAIREHEQAQGLAPTPIIAVTADSLPDSMARCVAAGMTGHVAKPIRLEALLDAIGAALAPAEAAEPHQAEERMTG